MNAGDGVRAAHGEARADYRDEMKRHCNGEDPNLIAFVDSAGKKMWSLPDGPPGERDFLETKCCDCGRVPRRR